MSRVKAGFVTRRRHKKIIKRAKGYYGRRKNTFKLLIRPLKKLVSILIGIEKLKKDNLEVFGSKELMLVVDYMV